MKLFPQKRQGEEILPNVRQLRHIGQQIDSLQRAYLFRHPNSYPSDHVEQ